MSFHQALAAQPLNSERAGAAFKSRNCRGGTAPASRASGSWTAVMGLSYVEDVHLELHDNIPDDVHFVAETAFVKGIVSVESSGREPVGVDRSEADHVKCFFLV